MLLTTDLKSDARVYHEARSLLKYGYDITVVMWNRKSCSKRKEIYDGIKVDNVSLSVPFTGTHVSLFPYLVLFNLMTFFKLLFMDFDVVHCHDLDTLLAGLFAGKLKHKKIVYDAHEIYPLMVQPYVPKIIDEMLSLVEFSLIKKVDSLVTVSEILSDYFKKGVRDKDKISVIMNCKDARIFKTSKKEITELKERLGIEKHFIILYDGWLMPDNGLEELFCAIEKLDGQMRDMVAVICGDGYAEEEFRRMVKEKNIENYVKFVGKLQSKDIPLFVNACDVMYVVRRSTAKYNFLSTPNRLFEAVIAGKPVIASNFGNVRRIVERGGFGLLVNFEKIDELCSALLRLKHDKRLREELSEKAKSMSKTYNWASMEKKLLHLYENL
jgi:glycosyltransferase involved in cell wall biosynthesis